MSIPLLGQQATTIPAQLRLNVAEDVGAAIANVRSMGLHHGRVILRCPINSTDLQYLLWLDCLQDAGGVVLAVTEIPIPDKSTPLGASLQVHVLFRIPEVRLHG